MSTPRIYVDLLESEEEKFLGIKDFLLAKGIREGKTRSDTVRYMINKVHEAIDKNGKLNLFYN